MVSNGVLRDAPKTKQQLTNIINCVPGARVKGPVLLNNGTPKAPGAPGITILLGRNKAKQSRASGLQRPPGPRPGSGGSKSAPAGVISWHLHLDKITRISCRIWTDLNTNRNLAPYSWGITWRQQAPPEFS